MTSAPSAPLWRARVGRRKRRETGPYARPAQWDADQPPTAAEEARAADRKRAAEIDRSVAERQLTPSRPQAWEVERALRQEVARLREENARLRKRPPPTERNRTLDDEVIAALGRVPRSATRIVSEVRASYGEVDGAQLYRHLKRLVKEGRAVYHPDYFSNAGGWSLAKK